MLEIQISPCSAVKLEKFLSSPPLKGAENSLKLLKGITLGKCNFDQDTISYCNNEKTTDKNNADFRSPFKTPPSCHDKVFYLFIIFFMIPFL